MLGRGPTAGDADPSSSKPAPEKGTAAAAAAAGQSIIRAGGAESQTEYATIAATAAAGQSTIRAGGAESQTEYAAIAATAAAGQSTIRAWGAESQTEYAAIPPKAKKRDRDALTDRQREVRQRQRQGDRLQEELRLLLVPSPPSCRPCKLGMSHGVASSGRAPSCRAGLVTQVLNVLALDCRRCPRGRCHLHQAGCLSGALVAQGQPAEHPQQQHL